MMYSYALCACWLPKNHVQFFAGEYKKACTNKVKCAMPSWELGNFNSDLNKDSNFHLYEVLPQEAESSDAV